MKRVILGDNQFFAVSHLSEDRAISQAIKFRDVNAITDVLDAAAEVGVQAFSCTTHERMEEVCDHIRANPQRYHDFEIYPAMPYAHKYANAITELGVTKFVRQYAGNDMLGTLARGGAAFMTKDFVRMSNMLVDMELVMFRDLNTPVVFLQNVVTDLLLGLGMVDLLEAFAEHLDKKHSVKAGYMTMNLPLLAESLAKRGFHDPIICASINKIGFRMSGGIDLYESCLAKYPMHCIAMQPLAAGALRPAEAFEYVARLKGVDSVLFGASTRDHIASSTAMIDEAWLD